MKIEFLVHQFLPVSSTGTEILTYRTAKEFQRRGHDVEIVTPITVDPSLTADTPFYADEYDGLPVYRYKYNPFVPDPNKCLMEFQYNNLSFAKHFREHVNKSKPDLVHFFHLFKLSVSPIDVCVENKIPAVYTPTDFWAICPTYQLRLPDNALCLGPDPDAVNCIRHVVSMMQPGWVSGVVDALPDICITALSRLTGNAWWPEKRLTPSLHYLTMRKDYVMKRINRLNRVLVPTRFMEKMLVQGGLDREQTRFIPFGLDLKPFENVKPRKHNERPVFGFIGTISEHKGTHILIDAVKRIPKETAFHVRIYGNLNENSDYSTKLLKMSEGEKRIEFCGTFPNEKIAEVFSGLDALVVPSIWYENTPLVIYSAHAAKVPVIGTHVGGISEVVHHEENGLLFELGDYKGLSDLMKRVIEDRTLLERLAENLTLPPSIPDYVDRLEEVYKDILALGNHFP